jgi:hypothetical protein
MSVLISQLKFVSYQSGLLKRHHIPPKKVDIYNTAQPEKSKNIAHLTSSEAVPSGWATPPINQRC